METNVQPEANWFVGANWGKDQTPRFLREGIWENGHKDKFQDLVRSMRRGDRIAIKSAPSKAVYDDLPFDNHGKGARVMYIKAIGTITENLNDGQPVRVDWTKQYSLPRKWYFFSKMDTVWRVKPGDWWAEGLLAFTFDGRDQNIDRFIEKYSSTDTDEDNAVSDDEGGHVNNEQNDKFPNQHISVNVPNFKEIFERMEKNA